MEKALHDFHAENERPTFVVVHSHIGYGTDVEDTPKAHGEPLGPEGVKAAKRFFGWPEDAEFLVPEGVYEHFAEGIGARGKESRETWQALFNEVIILAETRHMDEAKTELAKLQKLRPGDPDVQKLADSLATAPR